LIRPTPPPPPTHRHDFHTTDRQQDIYVVADSANLFSGAQMVDGKRNMDIKGA
jgi:hypothetical protein